LFCWFISVLPLRVQLSRRGWLWFYWLV